MKYINLFLASVLSGSALADISWSATVVSKGKKIDWIDSGLEFVPIPPKSHYNHPHRGGNHTANEEHNDIDKRATISYSSTWCGISQRTPRSADPVTNVFGFFSAPDLTERPGFAYPQLGAAWVGIDGGTCQSSLAQAGIQTIVSGQALVNLRGCYLTKTLSSSTQMVDRVLLHGGNGCPGRLMEFLASK